MDVSATRNGIANALGAFRTAQSASVDPVASALRRPAEALARETESAQVRLSAYGQVKSAVAEVQSTAQGLADLRPAQGVDAARKAAKAFVDAYNAEQASVARLTRRGEGQSAGGALADDGTARRVANETRREVTASPDTLRQLGIAAERDGTLRFDAERFNAAYAANPGNATQSLNQIGRTAQATATRQLGEGGALNGAISTLNTRVDTLQTRQSELQNRFQASQRDVQEQLRRLAADPFAGGVAAYSRVFSS